MGYETKELIRAGSYAYCYIFKPLFTKDVYPDMAKLEEITTKEFNQYNWTIIRPPGLCTANNKQYRTSIGDHALSGGGWLGRAQLADCLLNILTDNSTIHKIVWPAL